MTEFRYSTYSTYSTHLSLPIAQNVATAGEPFYWPTTVATPWPTTPFAMGGLVPTVGTLTTRPPGPVPMEPSEHWRTPIIAFRWFRRLLLTPYGLGLTATGNSYEWRRGPQRAICHQSCSGSGPPGGYDCCGFWAYERVATAEYHQRHQVTRGMATGDVVLGAVQLWGEVAIAQVVETPPPEGMPTAEGSGPELDPPGLRFRAEYAEIIGLREASSSFLSPVDVEALAEAYQVPLVATEGFETWAYERGRRVRGASDGEE